MHNGTIKRLVFGGALLGLAVAAAACTVDTTDTNNSVASGGYAGSSGTAGTGGTAGASGAGAAGASGAGAAGASGAGAGGVAGGGAGGAGGEAGGAGVAGAAGAAGGGSGVTAVRFAHVSPGTGPADVCIRAKDGTEWTGPYFSTVANAAGAFYYPGVTNYIEIPTGNLTFRLVDGAAKDCNTAFQGVADVDGYLTEGASYNLILAGDVSTTLTFKLTPDAAGGDAAMASFQVFNSLTQTGAIDFGQLNANGELELLVPNVVAYTNGTGMGAPASLPLAAITHDKMELLGQSPAFTTKAGQRYTAFVHGTKIGDATPGLAPNMIFCLADPTNSRETGGTVPLIAERACCYGSDPNQACTQP